MNREEIIDCISIILCTQQYKIIIIHAKTMTESSAFIEDLSKRIPNYVGMKKSSKSKFETKGNCAIYCCNDKTLLKGLSFNILFILDSVKSKQKEYMKQCYVPCGNVIVEVK